jgi:hypothetical protein
MKQVVLLLLKLKSTRNVSRNFLNFVGNLKTLLLNTNPQWRHFARKLRIAATKWLTSLIN